MTSESNNAKVNKEGAPKSGLSMAHLTSDRNMETIYLGTGLGGP
jgi:hypothetical protein